MKNLTRVLIASTLFLFIQNALFAFNKEVLVYRNESMPWCGTIDGKDAGIMVDILSEVTKNGGPVFIYSALPWPRAKKYVQENLRSTIIPLTRTSTREKQYQWIIKMAPNQLRLTLTRDTIRKFVLPSSLSLERFKLLPVGVIRGSAILPLMRKLGFTEIQETGSAEQNARKLADGRIAAIVESKWVDNYHWKKIGQRSDDLVVGPTIGDALDIYLAGSLDFSPETAQQIREAMEKAQKSGAIEAIINKWTR